MISPIEIAVMPLKNDAVERARQAAEADITRVREALEKHGGDINAAAPYPSRNARGVDYQVAKMRYNLFHGVTERDPAHRPNYQPSQPSYVLMSEEKAKRYVEQRMIWAGEDYDAFVRKLVTKIGEVEDAKLVGNHVWSYSTLVVTTKAGEQQAWKTQQIVNYSKLGKPFNQWPTRRLKQVPREALAA